MNQTTTKDLAPIPLREKFDLGVLIALHLIGLTIGLISAFFTEKALFGIFEVTIVAVGVASGGYALFALVATSSYCRALTNLRLQLSNINLIVAVHLIGLIGGGYCLLVNFTWQTLLLSILFYLISGLGVTMGYHRLFTHGSFKTYTVVEYLLLTAAASSVQGKESQWVRDHANHHAVDAPGTKAIDPHDINRGFWYAHIFWIFWRREESTALKKSKPARAWQNKHYDWIMIGCGFVLPSAIAGILWGDYLGGLMIGGFLRTVIQWHATWCVNSVAHTIGDNEFYRADGSRNNFIMCILLLLLGEMYHSFHHQFPRDYRNGWRWYNLDSTKWAIWTMERLGLAWDLVRTPKSEILSALEKAKKAKGQNLALL